MKWHPYAELAGLTVGVAGFVSPYIFAWKDLQEFSVAHPNVGPLDPTFRDFSFYDPSWRTPWTLEQRLAPWAQIYFSSFVLIFVSLLVLVGKELERRTSSRTEN